MPWLLPYAMPIAAGWATGSGSDSVRSNIQNGTSLFYAGRLLLLPVIARRRSLRNKSLKGNKTAGSLETG
jgi:hypothetical protein